jgi:hypothetical protein
MSFRIDRIVREGIPVLRMEGLLVGHDTWRVLCDQITRAVSDGGGFALDVSGVTGYDDACLAAIEASLGCWLWVEGGGEYLRTLLGQRRGIRSP